MRTVAEPVAAMPAPRPAEPAGLSPVRPGGRPSPVWPGLASFATVAAVGGGTATWAWQHHDQVYVLGWITTVLWTLPILHTLLGLAGALRARRLLEAYRHRGLAPVIRNETLLVVVPTIGRDDTYPALERVAHSCCRHLPRYFRRLEVQIVIEEGCEAVDAIKALACELPLVKVQEVPCNYVTPGGTRFKARANQYANERRIACGEARDDVWVLHMDDDTGVGADTAEELAWFIRRAAQWDRGSEAPHLAQGVLTYPREHGARWLLWMADAVRPASDVSTFAITTGRGTPSAGLHGELLLVRASVEARIGWDFGPRAVVEDAQFALRFCERYPGRSAWFGGRSLGATPATLGDFVRQRERWAWGLMELAADSSIALRHRLLLIHNIVVWACGPLQHVGVILLAGALLGRLNTLPATAVVLPLWALNIGYQVWCYWEGSAINRRSSEDPRRSVLERVCTVLLIPLFSLFEAAGVLRGLVRFMRRTEAEFVVITKPL